MPRDLTAEERALWRRVTADLRGEPVAPPRPAAATTPPPTKPQKKIIAPSRPGTTLDAAWDQRLKSGLAPPDRIVDLHGLGVERAHARALMALADAVADGDRVLLIVTGKPPPKGSSRLDDPLRGIIRASLGDWLSASPHARDIAAVRAAHPRHGGIGALYIVLRRRRNAS